MSTDRLAQGDAISGAFQNAEWTALADHLNGADLQTVLGEAAIAQRKIN